MATVSVDMTGIVKVSSSLHVRNRPSTSGAIIGRVYNGKVLEITKKNGNWVYAKNTGGWSHTNYITLKDNNKLDNVVKQDKAEQERLAKEQEKLAKEQALSNQLNAIAETINSTTLSDAQIVDSMIVHNLNGIYGIPYQFMDSVDPRLTGSVMGRKYSEKILSKMPLLCITPGKVEFMSNYSKSEQEGLLASLMNSANGVETDISNIISKNGRYFTFGFASNDYFDYVNGLCQSGARFLDIHNVELDIGGTKALAKRFDWKTAINKNFKQSLTSQDFIGFYMDSTDSVTESFGNDTTQSQIASTINGFSDIGKEIGFLLGAGAQNMYDQLVDKTAQSSAMQALEDISKKYLSNNLLSNIGNNFQTIATGGKLLFPEIWSDSSFSRSFDITIKLRTPDADVVSWYLNIYVPLCHLIALAAGHQTDTANGYYSPFLVRAFYKGLFNVDMGIITDMTITKGKEAAWSVDGLPTEVDVSITIKDLYSMLSIVKGNEAKNFVANNILMDYIANMCGININKMDIQRSLEIYYILTTNKAVNLPNSMNRRIQDAIDTYGMNLYNTVLNKFLL